MRQRQAPRFRPTLDTLETRRVLSVTAPVAEVATPSPPVVTRSTIKAALAKADKAFDSFQGRDSIGILKTIGGLAAGAADYVASAILTPNSTPDTSPGTTDHGYITGGKGDPHALEGRLRTALGQLPFGKTRGPADHQRSLRRRGTDHPRREHLPGPVQVGGEPGDRGRGQDRRPRRPVDRRSASGRAWPSPVRPGLAGVRLVVRSRPVGGSRFTGRVPVHEHEPVEPSRIPLSGVGRFEPPVARGLDPRAGRVRRPRARPDRPVDPPARRRDAGRGLRPIPHAEPPVLSSGATSARPPWGFRPGGWRSKGWSSRRSRCRSTT